MSVPVSTHVPLHWALCRGGSSRGLVRCSACGCMPVIRGGGLFSFCPKGGAIALEVCLAGHYEGCAPCMVVSWLQVAGWGSRRWDGRGGHSCRTP